MLYKALRPTKHIMYDLGYYIIIQSDSRVEAIVAKEKRGGGIIGKYILLVCIMFQSI